MLEGQKSVLIRTKVVEYWCFVVQPASLQAGWVLCCGLWMRSELGGHV